MFLEKHNKESVHKGHRERERLRFMKRGFDGWPEHSVLEFILFHGLAQGDTNETAHRLMKHFGSFAAVLDAHIDELLAVKGIGPCCAALIKTYTEVFRVYESDKVSKRRCFDSIEEAANHIRPRFIGLKHEILVIMCFDSSMRLMNVSEISKGTVMATEINIRKILEISLRHSTAQIILAHNHPDNIILPSMDDLTGTKVIAKTLREANIRIVEHLIFGNGISKETLKLSETPSLADSFF